MHDLRRCPRRKLYHAGPSASPVRQASIGMDEGAPCEAVKILVGAVWTGAGERHGPNPVPIRAGAGNEYTMRKPSESQDEDRSLLQRVARGDQAAFAALYDRYGASSFGMALKICNSRALAEDVVQEAFLSIWQRAGRFDPDRGSVAAYL